MANMRFFRFFINQKDLFLGENLVIFDKKLIHKIKNVLRFDQGEQISLFNGDGFDYSYEILEIGRNEIKLKFLVKNEPFAKPEKIKINLFISLIKKDKFEWILEKGTELGVSVFWPMISERSEKKDFSLIRGEAKITEALEQSGRNQRPVLKSVLSFSDLLKKEFSGVKVFLDFSSELNLKDFLKNVPEKFSEINIFVGPEGGWSETEKIVLQEAGFSGARLGFSVLKTETAVLSAVSVINF